MFKHLSKVRIEFNALDPRAASALEFLAQCNSRKARQSNPKCEVEVKRRTDEAKPRITVTFLNGKVQELDGTVMHANQIRKGILDQADMMETEKSFRDAGLEWPVIIPVSEEPPVRKQPT
jgi:large subunit ribosomal protein L53